VRGIKAIFVQNLGGDCGVKGARDLAVVFCVIICNFLEVITVYMRNLIDMKLYAWKKEREKCS
jgi:hypothetical protein